MIVSFHLGQFSTSMGDYRVEIFGKDTNHQSWFRINESFGSDQAMEPSNMLEEGPASKETPFFFMPHVAQARPVQASATLNSGTL